MVRTQTASCTTVHKNVRICLPWPPVRGMAVTKVRNLRLVEVGYFMDIESVLAMIRFSENLVRCRKLLFTQCVLLKKQSPAVTNQGLRRYFSVASQLDTSMWTTDDVDASEPCGHCDNCKRSPGSIEHRDMTQDAWKLIKILDAAGRPMTLKKLTSLARGNLGGFYDQKGKIDLKELIGAPISLRPIVRLFLLNTQSCLIKEKEAEHLFNHMMTEKYFVEKLDLNEHTTNVYYTLGPAASKLLDATLDNMPRGVVQHTFLRWVRTPPMPKVKKQENGKEPEGARHGKRKREAGNERVQNEQMEISEGETEEVEREVLDLTGHPGEMDVDEEDEELEVTYGWSHSMCEPPPVKRRRRRRRRSRHSTEYAPDSESERERGSQDVILISSD